MYKSINQSIPRQTIRQRQNNIRYLNYYFTTEFWRLQHHQLVLKNHISEDINDEMLKIVWYYCPRKYLPEDLIGSILAHHLDHQIAEMNFHLQFSPFFPKKYKFLITNSDSTSKITSELQKNFLAIDHLEWFNCDFVKNCNMQMRFWFFQI